MGFNYRMPSLNASLGISQLKKIKEILKAKLKVFKMYTSMIDNQNVQFKIYLSPNLKKFNNNWIVLVVCKNKKIRDIFLKLSIKYKIQIKPIWKPMHKLNYLKNFPKMNLSTANLLADTVLCLPSSPHIKLK